MHARQRARLALAAGLVILSGLAGPNAIAQDITTTVTVSSDRNFVPLQSYVVGEVDGYLIFFGGLENFGLHSFGQSAFPAKRFSTQIHMVERSTGDVTSTSILHLNGTRRRALTMAAATSVQYGDTLYIYGGYGPPVGMPDFHTRASVTAVNLDAVKQAILDSVPVPGSAIVVTSTTNAQVAGGGIVKLGDRFALICGANADGEYINAPEPEYTNRVLIFDRTVSMTTPVEILDDGMGFDSPMHRRDVNVLPVTLPAGGGGTRPGFIVVCGVFQSGIAPWENPLIWGEGDALPFMDDTFVQHMGAYEGPIVSLYSESRDINHALNYSGLSRYNYDSGSGQFSWNPSTPWTVEVTHLTIESGVFFDDVVVGEMPWPLTNAHLVLEDTLPMTPLGQVLIDQLPTETPILLGRIYGGIAADFPDNSPPTSGSSAVLDVTITIAREPGQVATLNDFLLDFGTFVSGGLPELLTSDNTYVRLRSRVGFSAQEPNLMRCTFGFTSPLATPAQIDCAVESRLNQPGGTSRLRFRNWSNNVFEQVHQYSQGVTEATETVYDISAANRVRASDQRIEMQISNSTISTFSVFGFDTSIDQVQAWVR